MNNDLQIKKLTSEDVLLFKKLFLLFKEVFEMEEPITASEPYLKKLLEKPDFIAYVSITDNEVVGGLTAYEMSTYYTEGSEVYIYDIAVSSGFQRKGVGKQLISSLKDHCKQNNIKIVFVEAHEEDTHAIEFYLTTGGKPEKVVHFNYFLEKE